MSILLSYENVFYDVIDVFEYLPCQLLGAFKLARKIFEKLGNLRLPAAVRDAIEFGALTIRSKRFSDTDDLLPVCVRCAMPNPLLSPQGEQCSNCKHAFYRWYCLILVNHT